MGDRIKSKAFALSAIFLTGVSSSISAENDNDDIFSLEPIHKMNPCYWLSREIPGEGLCGAKMRPDVKVLIKEAEKGNSIAAMRLGQLYAGGNWGIEQNSIKAVKWYIRAAELGDRPSQIKLGHAYEFGRLDVEPDIRKAIKFYTMATENGIYPDLEEKIKKLEFELSQ